MATGIKVCQINNDIIGECGEANTCSEGSVSLTDGGNTFKVRVCTSEYHEQSPDITDLLVSYILV